MQDIKGPLKVFVSYARADRDYLAMLRMHLSALERKGLIMLWGDNLIEAGTKWTEEITKALEEADIYLFLVSSDFLASDYIYNHDIEIAIAKHESGEASIIPIIVRSCDWTNSPIGKFNALPRRGMPISNWENRDDEIGRASCRERV